MKKIVAVFGLSVGLTGVANAALPAVIDTSITTDALALIDKGWPLLIAIFGGMLFMRLFKRVGNKVT
ncbi:MAG: hypothetical protein HYX62_06525 [Gammaproteobacteria bacterium]|jgi:hypothetical protein|nr:hypothetical protein [Gammaproteobacteria bacterium]